MIEIVKELSPFQKAQSLQNVKLVHNPRPDTLKEIENLAGTFPKVQDILFQNWAKELHDAVKERPPLLPNKKELKAKLEEISPLLIDELRKAFERKLSGKKPENFSKFFGDLFVKIFTDQPGMIELFMRFESLNAEVNYKWDTEDWQKRKKEGTVVNMHRTTSPEIGELGIGSYMENITIAAARKLNLSKIYFETGNSNPSLTWGLAQDYVCETPEDRKETQNTLVSLFTNKRNYNIRRDIPPAKGICLVKYLK